MKWITSIPTPRALPVFSDMNSFVALLKNTGISALIGTTTQGIVIPRLFQELEITSWLRTASFR
jgi:hypothetical protein